MEYIAEEAAALRGERHEASLRAAIGTDCATALKEAIVTCAAATEATRVEARRLLEASHSLGVVRERESTAEAAAREADKWMAAEQRGEQCDDAPAETLAESKRNLARAQATRERIVGEAKNGCKRVTNGASRFYVTPPINAYYRRLVPRPSPLLAWLAP